MSSVLLYGLGSPEFSASLGTYGGSPGQTGEWKRNKPRWKCVAFSQCWAAHRRKSQAQGLQHSRSLLCRAVEHLGLCAVVLQDPITAVARFSFTCGDRQVDRDVRNSCSQGLCRHRQGHQAEAFGPLSWPGLGQTWCGTATVICVAAWSGKARCLLSHSEEDALCHREGQSQSRCDSLSQPGRIAHILFKIKIVLLLGMKGQQSIPSSV
jgi:hypothetical protein